ncbi:MAG TPA: YdaS family helix-turn-helix protein [Burkholderiales bacterium]|nr:YdaS family helix-turn-helix protein [Burkholderiales bacterium]
MSHSETYRNTLTYALAIAGSERMLAARLGVKMPQIVNWLMGVEPIPTAVFLKVVDVVLNATAEEIKVSRERLNKLRSRANKESGG